MLLNVPVGAYLFIAFIALFVGLVIWAIIEERKRRQALRQLADDRRFSYAPKAPDALFDEVKMFRLFDGKTAHSLSNVIVGEADGANLLFFDYTVHNPKGGKNNTYQSGSIILISSDYLDLPTMYMRPETFLDRFNILPASAVDITFDSEPAFSGKYVLNGDDPGRIHKILTRKALDLLVLRWPLTVEA